MVNGIRKLYSHYIWHANTGHWPVDDEVVHHIDGDPSNDEFDNLALMNRKEHTSMHNRGENHPMFGKRFSGEGCIVDKMVGKWGPYRYLVTKHKGRQTWKYLGRTDKFENGLVSEHDKKRR